MTYYRVEDSTWWLTEANCETDAIRSVMEDRDAPDPSGSGVSAKSITQCEFEGLETANPYPNIREQMGTFLRADMKEMLKFTGSVHLTFRDGKFELEVSSADSFGYSESWKADSMEELEKLVELHPTGM